MKRSLLVASCVLLVSGLLSSCQKEDKSVVELAHELTAELQKITDFPTAESLAPRVEVLNKRFENARVRVLALNDTALYRSADGNAAHQGASYAAALKALAREHGRVRASFPSATSDGEVDKDKLLIAIGSAQGEKGTEDCKAAGLRIVEDETGAHETPGSFPEYFGSDKLRDALAYRASVTAASSFEDAETPAVPEAAPVSEDAEPASATADEEPSAGDDEDTDEEE